MNDEAITPESGGSSSWRETLLTLWRRWRKHRLAPGTAEIPQLSGQFRVTLRAAANNIRVTDQNRKLLDQVKKLLGKKSWDWTDAYEVEQQMVLLYGEETLRTELSRRVLEAQRVLYPDAAAWYRDQLGQKKTIPLAEQRALLSRLVNDLQWRYTVNEAKLGYVRQITARTGRIFIFAVALFIWFLFLLFAIPLTEVQGAAQGLKDLAQWVKSHAAFLTFMLAAVSGFLGASFSMVSSLKTRLESSSLNQMKNASSWAILFSRVLVGTGAAMILYFFFESNLLAGEAFPRLLTPRGSDAEAANPAVQRALLVVWCFIAGFSEKLVPGLLAKTEGRLNEQQAAPHAPASTTVPAAAVIEEEENGEEEAPSVASGKSETSGAKGKGKGS